MKNLILIVVLTFLCNLTFAQVGIGTTDPKSTLDINGTLSVKHVELIGSSTMPTLIRDGVYISISPTCESCFGTTPVTNQEFQLPDPDEFPGRIYIIRNITDEFDADITIDPLAVGAEFFAGNSTGSSGTRITMATTATPPDQNATKTLIFISDDSNWTYGILGF